MTDSFARATASESTSKQMHGEGSAFYDHAPMWGMCETSALQRNVHNYEVKYSRGRSGTGTTLMLSRKVSQHACIFTMALLNIQEADL